MTVSLAQALSARIKGRVADSGDRDYGSAIAIDNGRISHEPLLVVVPSSVDDVSATLKFARDNGLRITTKSGGHSATGYCLNTGGIVMDMRELRAMSFDRSTGRLKMGTGARWSAAYDYMENSGTGLIPIGGGCPGVGIGGFLLGGGFSFVSRSYGLGADSVKSLTIVTADGSTHVVDENSRGGLEDLFWACRGGGGGNFGVVTDFEVQAHKPGAETMLVGQVQFPFYRIEEILHFYNEWVETLPQEMAVYGFIGLLPDPRAGGTPVLSLRFTPVYNGPFADGVRLLQPLIDVGPIGMEMYSMTLPQWEDYIGSVTLVRGRSAYMRSAVLPPGGMTKRVAETMLHYWARVPSTGTFMVWTHTGGAIENLGGTDTAFPHRRARFVPEVKAIWDSARPEDMRANVEWAYDFFEELGREGDGSYVNYIDPLLTDWQQKYYGANYARLVAVKRHFDPHNLFDFQQAVGSAFAPSSRRPLDLSPLSRT